VEERREATEKQTTGKETKYEEAIDKGSGSCK
jgi:hypothetical protein